MHQHYYLYYDTAI